MSDPLDPLGFPGCFAELNSDLPDRIGLADWRSEGGEEGQRFGPAAGRAPQGRSLRARWRARQRSADPRTP